MNILIINHIYLKIYQEKFDSEIRFIKKKEVLFMVNRGARGNQEKRRGLGPQGMCVCPECGEEVPHKRGVPCYERPCPQCGAKMVRK